MDAHSPESPEIVLERLEASIEQALHRLIDGGRIDTHHRESVEGFRRRLADLKQRLGAAHARDESELPAGAQSDFDLLAWDYKRWIAEIDREFEGRAPRAPDVGRGAAG